jgi:hypothetical protein
MFSACQEERSPANDANVTPVYNQQTGRLDSLISDRDRNGAPDTWARMDGAIVKSIEVDRDGDGKPDRWEYYQTPGGGSTQKLERVEESAGADGRITRREIYADGTLEHVEEDTDRDGKVDKWEYHAGGRLARIDLDIQKKGHVDRRLIYDAAGRVVRMEADPDGDGQFSPISLDGREAR